MKLTWKKMLFTSIILSICFSTPTPIFAATQTFLGIDVSKNNGTVQWELVANAGYQFAMIKTGNGQDTASHTDQDSQFEFNYNNAKAAYLSCGVYHMIAGNTPEDAKKEANYCLSIIDGRPLDLPIAYDIESTKSFENSALFQSGKKNITDMAIAFCETIKKAGYTPMIYTSSYIYNTYLDSSRLTDYKIWIAHHDAKKPSIDSPYHMWQYKTDSVEGANTSSGVCDINRITEKLSFPQNIVTIGKGETLRLTPTLFSAFTDTSIAFSSSAPNVATVSKTGLVDGKKISSSTITATSSHNTRATCKIIVKKAPTSISFIEKNKTLKKKTLKKGQSYSVKTALSKNSASYSLTYSSSNKKVATIDSNGKITAKKVGATTIKVKTYNGKTASLKLSVKK